LRSSSSRIRALKELELDAVTRQQLADSAQLEASAGFVKQVNAVIDAVTQLPPRSDVRRMRYRVPQYRALQSFEMFADQCDTPAAWMDTGCELVGPWRSRVERMQSRLRRALKYDLRRLASLDLPSGTLARYETSVSEGTLDEATRLHDLLLDLASAGTEG